VFVQSEIPDGDEDTEPLAPTVAVSVYVAPVKVIVPVSVAELNEVSAALVAVTTHEPVLDVAVRIVPAIVQLPPPEVEVTA
jgi:hypothetical protein